MAKTIINVRYESDAPYTEGEKNGILTEIRDIVTEIDVDADANSFNVTAMTEAEEKDAKEKLIKELLESATVSATVSISHGSTDVAISMVEDED